MSINSSGYQKELDHAVNQAKQLHREQFVRQYGPYIMRETICEVADTLRQAFKEKFEDRYGVVLLDHEIDKVKVGSDGTLEGISIAHKSVQTAERMFEDETQSGPVTRTRSCSDKKD